ncbi:MAG: bacteriohemerythrin [Planctomycetota bacterium]|jgi:hemerythrin
MAFFEWDESYTVNIAEIDRQHKQLIELINHVYDALQQSKNQDTMKSAIDELDAQATGIDEMIDYTCYHFSTEEDYMLEYQYPGYDRQKEEHEQFVEKVKSFKRDFDEGKAVLSMELVQFLRKWLAGHILGLDKKYGPFLNEKGLK